MKKILVFVLLGYLFIFKPVSASAVTSSTTVNPTPTEMISSSYELPYPGIFPDHPLYFLKVIRDRILVWVTSDPIKKVELNMIMADKRLVMGSTLWEEGKKNLAISTLSKGEKYFDQAVLVFLKEKSSSKDNISVLHDRLLNDTLKHNEIIKSIRSKDKENVVELQKLSDQLNHHYQDLEKTH